MHLITSTPAPPSPSHPRASLSTLPQELKRLIVEKVAEGGRLDWWDTLDGQRAAPKRPPWADSPERSFEGYDKAAEGEGDGGVELEAPAALRTRQDGNRVEAWRMPLRSMAMVNREFAALAEPYLWENVNLEAYSERETRYFLDSVLPRYVRHVKSVTVCWVNYRHLAGRFTDPEIYSEAHHAAADSVAAWDLRELPASLLAREMGRMPKLAKVRCPILHLSDPSGLATRRQKAGGTDDAPGGTAYTPIATALAALGPRLVDLEILCDSWSTRTNFYYDQGQLATFLAHFPSLSRFSLRGAREPMTVEGRESFISTLSSLPRLKSLRIKTYSVFDDAFAAASWACRLESLSLPDCLPIATTLTLLSNFSGSLTALSLYAVQDHKPEDDGLTTSPVGTPFPLPHLETLIFASRFSINHLASFAHCPLRYLTIHFSPLVTRKEWRVFIKSHAKTLQRVTIGPSASKYGPLFPGRRMAALCKDMRIECVVRDDRESADEDEDEDW